MGTEWGGAPLGMGLSRLVGRHIGPWSPEAGMVVVVGEWGGWLEVVKWVRVLVGGMEGVVGAGEREVVWWCSSRCSFERWDVWGG